MTIIRNRRIMFNDDESLNEEALLYCIEKHKKNIERYNKLDDYYNGKHAILSRRRKGGSNNIVIVNHAEYITDFATGYFMGSPITYKLPDGVDGEILKQFKKTNIDMVDTELTRDSSKFGVAYELIYQNKEGDTRSTNIDPRNMFIVVDDTVEYNPLLGVHIYSVTNAKGEEIEKSVNVYLNTKIVEYRLKNNALNYIQETVHQFGRVPIIEYWNKSNQTGDYEGVLHLIEAYNLLQSDRINDKEQFVNALLVIYGVLAGDTTDEKLSTARELKKLGMLEMPEGARAEYISKTFNEQEIEVLKKSIAEDIHKISKVPNLTDENFAGNSSGVAMKYKLLGLEQLAKNKESYYRMGVRERLELYANIQKIKLKNIDVDEIEIVFTRSLPVNELELAQLVNNLNDSVSQETLISLLPFVTDVQAELERMKKQKEDNIKTQQEAFGSYEMKELEDDESEI